MVLGSKLGKPSNKKRPKKLKNFYLGLTPPPISGKVDHIWDIFEKKKYFSPLEVKNTQKNYRVRGTSPPKVTQKSVSKMTQNGLKRILNRSLKS